MAEDSCDIDGILVLLNTMGGDVEAGLAIAEMIASIANRQYLLYLAAVTQSGFRWLSQRTILSSYPVEP